MPQKNSDALDFLLSRRSRPAKTLAAPAPDHETVRMLLRAAARSPDHGKLEPWRFIVLEGEAFARLADLVTERGTALGREAADIEKARSQFDMGQLAVVVVESPKPSGKIPAIEQTYSAGAVCLALLNAALASGWGANWLTGWPAHDATFCRTGLGLSPEERVAGIIHIATETTAPPERPRPDVEAITEWVSR